MLENDDVLTIVVYRQGEELIDLRYHQETEDLWATNKEIAALFGVDENTISYHIGNV
ncbi:helix-turn-helix domain-containing protein [Yersinia intermedia]|nr:hypothetical protein [Yersinia intermedia]MCB5296300.1 hypothetical protein [Yersinia intermedia]